ncbi:MAG: YiiX/YebB-like N1pC/P60 family cysteine hydrolase [Candidatus Paceibacterota bacterium]
MEDLREGDIILSRSDERESVLIREASDSEYSHAILYVGAASCIESNGLGVQVQNLMRIFFNELADAIVLRLSEPVEIKSNRSITDYARQNVGMEYSASEARLANFKKLHEAKHLNRQFCTRFVAQAYSNANINIVANSAYCTPNDILNSEKLSVVENALREASEAEINFYSSKNNILEEQKDIINQILEDSRNLTGVDIQSFNQLIQFVVNNIKYDEDVQRIFKESGYFQLWEKEYESNPWNYSFEELRKKYPNRYFRKHVARFFYNTESQTRDRFIRTLEIYNDALKKIDSNALKDQVQLYSKLIELSEIREKVAEKALQE